MLKRVFFSIFCALALFSADVNAKTYQLPGDDLPNCEKNGNNYTCSGNLSFDEDDKLVISGGAQVVINVNGNVSVDEDVEINKGGNPLNLILDLTGNFKADESVIFNGSIDSDGHITFEESSEITGNLTAGGKVTIDEDSQLTGNIVAGKKVSIDESVTIDGNINAEGKVEIDEDSVVTGYVNAPDVSGEGDIQGETCDINDNIGPCSGSPGTPTIEPIGYWYFDELNWTGSNGEVTDHSENNYNGQALRNASTSGFSPAIDDDPGTCRYGKFSGDNVVQVPNATEITQADSISIAFWFKGDASLQNQSESYQTLLMVGDGPTESSAGRFEVYRQDASDGGGIYFEIRLGNNTIVNVEVGNQLEGGTQLLDNTWHHLAATYSRDDRQLQLFIDGNLIDQRSFNGNRNLNSVSNNLFIGGQSTTSNSFYGELDEVFISDEVMSTDNVLNLMLMTRPCADSRPQCSEVWPQGFSPVNNTPLPFDLPDRALSSQLPSTLQPEDYLRVGNFGDVGADYSTNGQTSRVYIDGDLTIQSGRRINTNGNANELILIVTGDLYLERDVEINGFLYVSGNLYFERSILPWFRTVVEGGLSLDGQASAYGSFGFFAPRIDYRSPAEPLDGGNFCNAGDVDPPVTAPHHYRLSYASPVLTCEAADVTVEACADASCSSYSPVSSSVFLSDSAGAWSQNPVAASPVSTTQLSQTEAGTYTLAIDDIQTTPGALNPTQCYMNGNFNSDCSITFNDTGLKFGSIGTQISGDSFTTNLSVVRTNDNTQACEVVAEQISQVDMGMHCVNPGSCSDFSEFPYAQMSIDQALINELQDDGSDSFIGWTPVTANFQAGQQALEVQYGDAGKVSLRAKAQLPNGKVIEGVSNEFVYKPASIGMETVSTYSGDILAKAGEPFFVALQALNSGEQVTPNFGRETPQESLDLAVAVDAVAPAEVNGELDNSASFIAQSVGNVRFENDSISYSEVGSAKVTAKVADANYLGAGSVTTEHILGRFIPYEFEPLTAEFDGACTDFYYMEQAQPIVLSAQAVNASGELTLNYTGSLAKATPLFYAYDSSENQLVDHNVNYDGVWEWTDGVGQFTGSASVTVSRLSSGQPDGPFRDYILGWQLDDQEDNNFYSTLQNSVLPASPGATKLDTANLYYGRFSLQDTYAAMDDVMPIAGTVEYWESGEFFVNDSDNCTVIERNAVNLLDESMASLEPEPINVQLANGLLSSPDKDINELFRWVPSGTDEPYSFGFEVEVPAYLQYDWAGNSVYDDNPQAEGTFGIYRGRDRQIYWRELGW
jgi:MSHA biogenesis protein MshQ